MCSEDVARRAERDCVSDDRARMDPSSEKLPARVLLRSRREFEEVYRKGTSYRGRYVVLVALSGAGISRRKVGFVASKKVGGAVRRNRAKRLMREAFRKAQKLMRRLPAHMVFIARPGAPEAGYHEVDRDLKALLARAGLLEEGD